ncbi:MAG: CHAT domain-containing protein, partial [Desulfobacteraceae bacterium]|nr:CHAT domain-containing protein [Desulfobacteraceae bacterium]
ISWIDGTLRSTIPGADLYLLNPAGLMFGPGALLDMGGSFHVSTADYLRMGDTEKFYAAPRESDVLSAANPAAFGFLDNNAAPITFKGGETESPKGQDNADLSVSKGSTISVIGGNIEIKGNINAPEGRINIVSVGSGGEVIPTDSGTDVSSFDKMGDIAISDKSVADVSGEGSGSVFIRGGRFFSDNSEINAETLGNKNGGVVDIRVGSLSFTNGASIITDTKGTGRGADTEIHATDSVAFSGERGNSDGSKIEAATKGAGDAGSLHIEASDISFTDGAYINAATYGKGKGGLVTLKASDTVLFAGERSNGRGSVIHMATNSESEGAGNTGNLYIEARDISFTDGAHIDAATYGKGKGGIVTLKASDTVLFAGERSNKEASRIRIGTKSESEGAGDAGTLHIEAGDISFTGGAYINATTYGKGKGGVVTLEASDTVLFAGETSNGNGSMIQMTTSSESEEAGNAGTLHIEAGDISFTDGAYINARTGAKGKGGVVTLKASDTVLFAGERSNGNGSMIRMTTSSESEEAGNAGTLCIEAGNISFTDGAYINAATEGKGNGGVVTLKASDMVSFTGDASNGIPSTIQMTTLSTGKGAGNAGTLLIESGNISFTDGAYINATTEGKGDGGLVTLKASDTVLFAGETSNAETSGIKIGTTFESEGAGNAGSLYIEARNISFTGGTNINALTRGKGNSGVVTLKASDIVSFAGETNSGKSSSIQMTTNSESEGAGDAGTLYIEAGDISFTDGAFIDISTHGKGNGGTATLKASNTASFAGETNSGNPSGIELVTDSKEEGAGNAGTLLIESGNISFTDGAYINATTYGNGKGGLVTLKCSDKVSFAGETKNGKEKSIIQTASKYDSGDAGSFLIEARDISFTDGAYINAATEGKGNGGMVTLKASNMVSFAGEASDGYPSRIELATVFTEEGAGNAGTLLIETGNISFTSGAYINMATFGRGNGGAVTLKASDTVLFAGETSNKEACIIQMATGYESEGAGNAGNLYIEAGDISFTDGAYIDMATHGKGNGGVVTLKASGMVLFAGETSNVNRSNIQIATGYEFEGAGNAGNLYIEAREISFKDGAYINISTHGKGNGGTAALRASDMVSFVGEAGNGSPSSIELVTYSREEGAGNAGTLLIETGNISFTDGAYINATTYGKGNGGVAILRCSGEVLFAGETKNGRWGSMIQIASQYDSDYAGSLLIEARDISFTRGANINSAAYGSGDGGEVTLAASDTVLFAGHKSDGGGSNIRIATFEQASGDAGTLLIKAKNISLKDNAYISGTTYGKGKAGTITLLADELISFAGRGINENGTVDSLSARVHKISTGGTGSEIYIETRDILLTHGAGITTTTFGPGAAGDINIMASGTVTVTGQDSMGYPSGIYAGSENLEAGQGGNINLSAQTLALSRQGKISTSSTGRGKAGRINLDVARLEMDTGSSIVSESLFVNAYTFSNIAERDNSIITTGDVIIIRDVENGMQETSIYTGKNMIRTDPVHIVADMDELNELNTEYYTVTGDVVEVADSGDGNAGRFICTSAWNYGLKEWVGFTGDTDVTFADMTEVNKMNGQHYPNAENLPPYSSGDTIKVNDVGDGKAGTYIYTTLYTPLYGGSTLVKIIRLKNHTVPGIAELKELPGHSSVREGDVAEVTGDEMGSRFVYNGDEWIKFNNEPLTVANTADLKFAQAGNSVKVDNGVSGMPGTFIYSGKGWITLNESHIAANMSELEEIPAHTGDVAYISNADGKGNPANLFYAGEWTEFVKGDANNITIKADNITMANKSEISTSAAGHGNAADIIVEAGQVSLDTGSSIFSMSKSERFGGNTGTISIAGKFDTDENGKVVSIEPADYVTMQNDSSLKTGAAHAAGGAMTVNVKNMLYLDKSMITTSVQGGDGRGGDIEISTPRVAILNNSGIEANAHGGDGGNIRIAAEQFIPSSDSFVDASSKKAIDGNIIIESPDADVSGSLTALSENYLDAARWLPSPCSERLQEKESRFVFRGRDGMPASLDDWLASPPLAFDKRSGFWSSEPGQILAKGEKFYLKGDSEQSVQKWEQGVSLLDSDGIPYFQTMLYLADVYQAAGHYQKALSALHSVLPVVEKSSDPFRKALFFSSLGDISLAVRNLEIPEDNYQDHRDPLAYLEKGLENARLSDNPLVLASVLNNMGNALAAAGNYWEAEESYNESLDIIAQESAREFSMLKSKVLINFTRAGFLSFDDQDIITDPDNILSQIESLPDSHNKASDLICFSLLVRKIQKKYRAGSEQIIFRVLNKAKQIAEDLEDERMISYSCGYLGQLYEEKKDYEKAIALTRKAVFSAQQNYCPGILYLWQWQMGRLFRASEDTENSVKAYSSAIETLDPIRHEFFAGYRGGKNLFNEKVKPVYLELAGLLMTGEFRDTDKETRLKQARDNIERLKKAELENFFEDECVTAMQKKISLPDHAPSHTAVIYPILLPDRLVLLLTLPDGMKQIDVPADTEVLRKDARLFRERLQDLSMKDRFLHYANKLYQCLIQPVESELEAREIDTLVIVPDGVLRLIPFSALHDGNRFLIEKYAVATIPAITLTNPEPAERKNSDALLNGLSEARQGFYPLPGVREELEDIKSVTGGRILLDEEYTIDNLGVEFENHAYPLIHMATHGNFGASPDDTYLLTYDGKLTMEGLEQLIGRSPGQVELLTLSACQTALGDERAGLGLAGIAIKAGVASAVATLWSIEDEAGSLLVREFYRQMKISGTSKAKALQNAQKKFIARQRYSHPAFWAPFLLIGNWL